MPFQSEGNKGDVDDALGDVLVIKKKKFIR